MLGIWQVRWTDRQREQSIEQTNQVACICNEVQECPGEKGMGAQLDSSDSSSTDDSLDSNLESLLEVPGGTQSVFLLAFISMAVLGAKFRDSYRIL